MLDVAVIIASTREGGFGTTVGQWFLEQTARRADLNVDVIALGRTALPPLQPARSGDTGDEARALAARVGAADGFVVITPEYNHGYPAALKLAIDSVRHEWAAKPVGFVSYGGRSGGLRAVEQLRLVFAELHVVSLRDTVSFHQTDAHFDAAGRPVEPDGVNGAAKVMLDQLTWWATTLREGRAARPYVR
ncbi:NADPH-dependent FMN reductase [Streptosporangium roseum]|uniref:Flavoprotein n=1 Tax=Streptosporangium roseum (strain ATCC 12428 / DSM 43021 / JCM 3005 / KCTC 9067 / NCIMB 10171 / NRRL 2505 / NI 9100) TaxID=479432 RepID=D2BCQ6_STRRD|nr:NAD(P)H-dependent oxidoreductase [Streptosporangium roseum]ACZ91876.1 flavoprotein [Streptosporangium roseum DSM 43021]